MSGRLATDFWLKAHIKRWNDRGIPMFVRYKGEHQSGAVMLVINRGGGGCMILNQTRTAQGELAWLRATPGLISEAEAEAAILRARRRDPDLWIVEIEDREGRHPFEGVVL